MKILDELWGFTWRMALLFLVCWALVGEGGLLL